MHIVLIPCLSLLTHLSLNRVLRQTRLILVSALVTKKELLYFCAITHHSSYISFFYLSRISLPYDQVASKSGQYNGGLHIHCSAWYRVQGTSVKHSAHFFLCTWISTDLSVSCSTNSIHHPANMMTSLSRLAAKKTREEACLKKQKSIRHPPPHHH